MEEADIRKRLMAVDQYKNRLNGLTAWERTASKKDRALFEKYVRNWLLLRNDGATIGWRAFCEMCSEDIPGFEVKTQALKAALSERIKRL